MRYVLIVLLFAAGVCYNMTCDTQCIDYISCMAKGDVCYSQGNYSLASILFEKAADYITLGSGQEREKALLYIRAADITENKSHAEELYFMAMNILNEYGYGKYIPLVQERLNALHSQPNNTVIVSSVFLSKIEPVSPYPLYVFLFIVVVGGIVILFKLPSENEKSGKTDISFDSQ